MDTQAIPALEMTVTTAPAGQPFQADTSRANAIRLMPVPIQKGVRAAATGSKVNWPVRRSIGGDSLYRLPINLACFAE